MLEDKLYQLFKKIELEWFHYYIFVDLPCHEDKQDEIEKVYQTLLSTLYDNVVVNEHPEIEEPNLVKPVIEELYDMFNMDAELSIKFIKRLYEEIYTELQNTTFIQGKAIIELMMEEVKLSELD